jgi:hypothetical protein
LQISQLNRLWLTCKEKKMSDTPSHDGPSQGGPSPNGREALSLRSVYTSNLPDILSQLNISLAISTYQTGQIVLVCSAGDTTYKLHPCVAAVNLTDLVTNPKIFWSNNDEKSSI